MRYYLYQLFWRNQSDHKRLSCLTSWRDEGQSYHINHLQQNVDGIYSSFDFTQQLLGNYTGVIVVAVCLVRDSSAAAVGLPAVRLSHEVWSRWGEGGALRLSWWLDNAADDVACEPCYLVCVLVEAEQRQAWAMQQRGDGW